MILPKIPRFQTTAPMTGARLVLLVDATASSKSREGWSWVLPSLDFSRHSRLSPNVSHSLLPARSLSLSLLCLLFFPLFLLPPQVRRRTWLSKPALRWPRGLQGLKTMLLLTSQNLVNSLNSRLSREAKASELKPRSAMARTTSTSKSASRGRHLIPRCHTAEEKNIYVSM